MQTISTSYLGRSYDVTFYSTTINGEILFFVMTNDPEAIQLLVEDHFFIRIPNDGAGMYWFNSIQEGNEEEFDFKEHISLEIFKHFLVPPSFHAFA